MILKKGHIGTKHDEIHKEYLINLLFFLFFLIRWLNRLGDFIKFWLVGLLHWVFKRFNFTLQKGYFVYYHWGYTTIYRPLSYPFRSLRYKSSFLWILKLKLYLTCPKCSQYFRPPCSMRPWVWGSPQWDTWFWRHHPGGQPAVALHAQLLAGLEKNNFSYFPSKCLMSTLIF